MNFEVKKEVHGGFLFLCKLYNNVFTYQLGRSLLTTVKSAQINIEQQASRASFVENHMSYMIDYNTWA